MGSTYSLTPCDSKTMSPAPWPFSSIIRPYWKPEHPPPCTNTRKPLPALFSSASSSLIFDAADSETLIMGPALLEGARGPESRRSTRVPRIQTPHYSKKLIGILPCRRTAEVLAVQRHALHFASSRGT